VILFQAFSRDYRCKYVADKALSWVKDNTTRMWIYSHCKHPVACIKQQLKAQEEEDAEE